MGSVITALAVDPRDTSTLYASVSLRTQTTLTNPQGGQILWLQSRGTIFRGTRDGKRWEPAIPVSASVYTAFAFDPSNASRMYAVGANVLRSTDRGDSWREILNLNKMHVRALAVDPSNGDRLYAIASALFMSSNGGKNWTAAFSQDAGMAYSVATHRDSRTLFVGTERGVIKSNDGGQSWVGASAGLGQVSVNAIAIDPSNPLVLFAATSAGGRAAVYKSADGGASWMLSNDQMDGFSPEGIAIAATNPSSVYVWGARSRGFKTLDAGTTWSPLLAGSSSSTETSALAIDPKNPKVIYVATKFVN